MKKENKKLKSIFLKDNNMYFNKGKIAIYEIELLADKIKNINIHDKIENGFNEYFKKDRYFYFKKMIIEIENPNISLDDLKTIIAMDVSSINLRWEDGSADICSLKGIECKKKVNCTDTKVVITLKLPQKKNEGESNERITTF